MRYLMKEDRRLASMQNAQQVHVLVIGPRYWRKRVTRQLHKFWGGRVTVHPFSEKFTQSKTDWEETLSYVSCAIVFHTFALPDDLKSPKIQVVGDNWRDQVTPEFYNTQYGYYPLRFVETEAVYYVYRVTSSGNVHISTKNQWGYGIESRFTRYTYGEALDRKAELMGAKTDDTEPVRGHWYAVGDYQFQLLKVENGWAITKDVIHTQTGEWYTSLCGFRVEDTRPLSKNSNVL